MYARINDKAYPFCDTAGYAAFGLGYRHGAGEFLAVGFSNDLLRKVWSKDPLHHAQYKPSRAVTGGTAYSRAGQHRLYEYSVR